MRRHDVVQWGPDRLRVATWRGDDHVAVVTPWPGRPARPGSVARTAADLGERGVARLLTPALPPEEQAPFLAQGFAVLERLHLLRHALATLPATAGTEARLRRGWRRDHPRVLAVDALAFDDFWRFDRDALVDARSATPSSQLRVAERDRQVVGYAVTGRAGDTCYLQRLAVHPAHQGAGVGSALAVDALRWAAGHGATSVLVNTQERNAAALALYEALGFTPEPHGLAVLERRLDHERAPA